jgi:pyruvate formate lyase activating enzyme
MLSSSPSHGVAMIDLPVPIESLPIGGFQPLTLSDFPGTPAALVFLRGCTMRCPYCHNRQLWRCAEDGADLTEVAVLTHLSKRRDQISGVVVSGGEPTIHERLGRFMQSIRALGLRVKLDTNGSRPDHVRTLLAANLIDYVALDLKAAWADMDRTVGVPGHAAAVAETLGLLRAWSPTAEHYELRTTVCAGMHDDGQLAAIAAALRPGERWFLQAYQPVPGTPDATRYLAAPSPAQLTRCAEQARNAGIICTIR